jgi:hypothetical protein
MESMAHTGCTAKRASPDRTLPPKGAECRRPACHRFRNSLRHPDLCVCRGHRRPFRAAREFVGETSRTTWGWSRPGTARRYSPSPRPAPPFGPNPRSIAVIPGASRGLVLGELRFIRCRARSRPETLVPGLSTPGIEHPHRPSRRNAPGSLSGTPRGAERRSAADRPSRNPHRFGTSWSLASPPLPSPPRLRSSADAGRPLRSRIPPASTFARCMNSAAYAAPFAMLIRVPLWPRRLTQRPSLSIPRRQASTKAAASCPLCG